MARRIDFATVGGMLCAGAALLLLSSGVPPVEAEDTESAPLQTPLGATPAPMLPPDGPSCRVDAQADAAARAEALADVNARLAADGQAAASDPDFVVLNNHGYNYGSQSVTDPQLLKFEAGSTPQ
jgi:hypothetical protein